jgi:hypothetical protein
MSGDPGEAAAEFWTAEFRCVGCSSALSEYDRLYSDGVCPKCGHQSDGTICDAQKVAVPKMRRSRPWWYFWGGPEYVTAEGGPPSPPLPRMPLMSDGRAKILGMLAFIDWHTNQADTEALHISPWDPEKSDNAGEARALNQASLSDREIRYAAHEIGAALGFTSEEIVAAEERLRRDKGVDAICAAATANPVAKRLANSGGVG